MSLELELATYERERPQLLDRAGKYVLIKGEQIASTWETYRDAIQEGYRLFQLEPFLVKRIQAVELPHHFTRDIKPVCRS